MLLWLLLLPAVSDGSRTGEKNKIAECKIASARPLLEEILKEGMKSNPFKVL